MKILLGILVLTLLIQSGSSLKCYNCRVKDVTKCPKVTCKPTEDTCISTFNMDPHTYRVYPMRSCTTSTICAGASNVVTGTYCCHADLCNNI